MDDSSHKRLALDERIAEALEKHTQAMGELSIALNRLSDAITTTVFSVTESTAPAVRKKRKLAPYAMPPNLAKLKALSRDEVKAMICELRDAGISYGKIANELNDRKIRTITGRGLWQGQTVYRLFHE